VITTFHKSFICLLRRLLIYWLSYLLNANVNEQTCRRDRMESVWKYQSHSIMPTSLFINISVK